MAHSAIYQEEPDYDLICPVCQDEFKDPVIIDCHHSFCRSCIAKWILHSNTYPRDQLFSQFKCPSCKTSNRLPLNGIPGLPKSFYVEQLKNAKSRTQPLYPMCPKHKTEDLRFFCMSCETTICRDCKVLKHEGHMAECVADVAINTKATLMKCVEQAQTDLLNLETNKTEIKKDSKLIARLKLSVRDMLNNQVEAMKGAIDSIARNVDEEICKRFQVYETEIVKEFSMAKAKASELQNFSMTVNQKVKNGTDYDILDNYKELLEKRQSIVIEKIRKPMNYKSVLGDMHRKGTLNIANLTDMIGALSVGQGNDEKSRRAETVDNTTHIFTEPKVEIIDEDIFNIFLHD